VLWLDEHEKYHTDIVVFLTCTAVFREPDWLDEAVRRLLARPETRHRIRGPAHPQELLAPRRARLGPSGG